MTNRSLFSIPATVEQPEVRRLLTQITRQIDELVLVKPIDTLPKTASLSDVIAKINEIINAR